MQMRKKERVASFHSKKRGMCTLIALRMVGALTGCRGATPTPGVGGIVPSIPIVAAFLLTDDDGWW